MTGKSLGIACAGLNALTFTTFTGFFVFSIASFPKKETKFFLCLMSLIEMIASTIALIQIVDRWVPRWRMHLIWATAQTYLYPLLELRLFAYICYSLHRFTVIVAEENPIKRFLSVRFVAAIFPIALILAYGMNLEDIALQEGCFCEHDCVWKCRIPMTVGLILRLITHALVFAMQFFVHKSTTRRLAESERFLTTLTTTVQIKTRLILIRKLSSFNKRMTILLVLPPMIKLSQQLAFSGVLNFCTYCDHVQAMNLKFSVFESIDKILRPTVSLLFVLMHHDKLRRIC